MEPAEVILVEGILVLAEPDLRELMDIRIYVDTDSDLRFIPPPSSGTCRIGEDAWNPFVTQYCETVRPMHLDFV